MLSQIVVTHWMLLQVAVTHWMLLQVVVTHWTLLQVAVTLRDDTKARCYTKGDVASDAVTSRTAIHLQDVVASKLENVGIIPHNSWRQ